MFKKFFLIGFLSLSLIGIAQNKDSIWVYANYTKQETLIKMRDGDDRNLKVDLLVAQLV